MNGNSTRKYLHNIAGFFEWCVQDRLLDMNPVQWNRLPSIPKEMPRRCCFNEEQYRRILDVAAHGEKWAEFWPSAIMIAWHTGLRCKDICTLRWDHDEHGGGSKVDFEQEIIVARPSKRDSIRQRLEIPMDRELYEHLLGLKDAEHLADSAFVLPLMYWRTYGRRDLHGEFRNMCDSCGLTEHSFHSFRHGFVTRLINAGVDPLTIGSMTGQSIEQVQEYCHISNGAKRNALEQSRAALYKMKLKESGAGQSAIVEV